MSESMITDQSNEVITSKFICINFIRRIYIHNELSFKKQRTR